MPFALQQTPIVICYWLCLLPLTYIGFRSINNIYIYIYYGIKIFFYIYDIKKCIPRIMNVNFIMIHLINSFFSLFSIMNKYCNF